MATGAESIPPELNRLSEAVIGAAIEVHRVLGPGFLESVYEEAMAVELESRGIAFSRQAGLGVDYKGRRIAEQRIDLLVDDRLILELKAAEQILPLHTAQLISYLKAARLRLGLLLNFNVVRMTDGIKRIAL